MRITGGKYRGRTVKCPPGIIRPAMDRMRESMFSILANIEGLSFLDLFSGSGCIGLEAASRGAYPIDIVEKDYKKKRVILENLSMAEEKINLFLMPVERFAKKAEKSYNIIHLDPPFPLPHKENFLKLVDEYQLLKEEGICMIHYPAEESLPEEIGSLRRYDLRKYGRSELAFYTNQEKEA